MIFLVLTPMFLKFIQDCNTTKIYSIAQIIKRLSHNTFYLKFENTYFTVYTHEKLRPQEWIRFVGTRYSDIINLEYVEVLHNIDINLLKKCISILK